MQTIFVVIKGNKFDAERACAEKDIEFTFEAESKTETYGFVDKRDLRKVIDWYSLDAGYGGEFQTGSLLWYAER